MKGKFADDSAEDKDASVGSFDGCGPCLNGLDGVGVLSNGPCRELLDSVGKLPGNLPDDDDCPGGGKSC